MGACREGDRLRFQRLATEKEVEELINLHNQSSSSVVIDVETTSKSPIEAKLIDVQISGVDSDSSFIFNKEYATFLLDLNPRIILIAHNYKYDAHVLYRHGVNLLDRYWRDTILVSHLVDENRPSKSLSSFVNELYLDNYKDKFWLKYSSYQDSSEEDRIEYACKDIVYTRYLDSYLQEQISLQRIPQALVDHVHSLARALLNTEIKGIKLDLDYIQDLGVKTGLEIEELKPLLREGIEPQIELCELDYWQKALEKYKTDKGKANCKKPTFSFDSSKQLIDLLYLKLGLPPQVNQKTKSISVDEDSLQNIQQYHPIIPSILKYRGLQKIQSTYIEGTLEHLKEGRVYPGFNVNGTVTGRISHQRPNLGNLPSEGGIRGMYIPDEGHCFLSLDYAQLEVCLEANITEDEKLKRIFLEGLSKHDMTAQELGIDRSLAKTLNFALQYWASHYKVAKLLDISPEEGLKVWTRYWQIYSGPKELKKKTDSYIDRGIPLRSLYGRLRRFENKSRNLWDSDYRQGYNFVIQSPGSDITSEAFYLTDQKLIQLGIGKGLFTVHDELIIMCKKDYAIEAEKIALDTMIGVGARLKLKIPLKAESSGAMPRWQD